MNSRIILRGFFFLMIIGAGLLLWTEFQDKNNFANIPSKIRVQISGAVENPGFYEFEEGTTLQQALSKIKLLKEADVENIGLSFSVTLLDGQKVYIPFRGTKNSNCKININTASKEELEELPGIGPVLAQRIIDFRSQYSFVRVEDLKKVKGIGEKIFAKVAPFICVE